ncbi:MAG: Na(+)-translocating NADH-quinone reductase subunit C [Halobacteriovoraceae bacterium]|nr:Na(+)-translocating NADH-quinone reductase subunit C [Halobacteriovoraceae bacterium]|tara:strand:- start:573 stop:1349 length:777 start_codon:yes stop_codon:yes gene_type:complete
MGNNVGKTLFVAFALCLVCSVLVSSTAVSLKDKQAQNAALDMKKNVLSAAGLLEADTDVNEVFSKFTTVLVNLETGEIVDDMDTQAYNQREAQKKPDLSVAIPAEADLAGLSRRAKFGKVFVYKDEQGESQIYIFHITSKGLWSTMYGFMALGADLNTVKGFGYYAQGETPGLGGEVDNPKWKGQWVGKNVYNEEEVVALKLSKGTAPKEGPVAEYRVDGLSGATITANGVSSSIKYWFSDHGYGKFIDMVKGGEVTI